MERDRFTEMMRAEFEGMLELNRTKGHDYAGDEDALANFKEAAERLDLKVEQVWAVYADKHWQAIMTYCREGQVASEPVRGRVRDAMVYCMLLLGLIVDGEDEQDEETRVHRVLGAVDE